MHLDSLKKYALCERIMDVTACESATEWRDRIKCLAECIDVAKEDMDWIPWRGSLVQLPSYVVEHFRAHDAIDKLIVELDRREQAQ